jgi:hypothetical protein
MSAKGCTYSPFDNSLPLLRRMETTTTLLDFVYSLSPWTFAKLHYLSETRLLWALT